MTDRTASLPISDDAPVAIEDWRPSPDLTDLSDPVMFPVLPDHLLEAIARQAVCREFEPGQVLFEQGVRQAPFLVVEEGRAVFFDRTLPDQADVYFSQIAAKMFIGDTAMFTGEPTVAECRALERTRVLELTHEQLRAFVRENSEASDLILRTLMARRAWLEGHGHGQLQLIGPRSCPQTYRLRDFLGRNQVPFAWRDTESDDGAAVLLDRLAVGKQDWPVLIEPQTVHRNPDLRRLAAEIGLLPELHDEPYDLVVIGGGPGGLAAAVYGASEGLDVLVLDAQAPGGQAGTSSKIENYLGFTTGISGSDLTRQAVLQARKFGATVANPIGVTKIDCGTDKVIQLDDGRHVRARSVIIATGACYRRLTAEGCERFEGVGVYYAAGHLEAIHCTDQHALVVGGGNSAGQAAVFLSRHAKQVSVLIRRDSLEATMSKYLIDRIAQEPNIEVLPRTEIAALHGEDAVHEAVLKNDDGERTVPCSAVFVMIGAEPQTSWLGDCCAVDNRGFVLTGQDAKGCANFASRWPARRDPYHLETSMPGIFAVGDVRSGSVKRVATAVGEGAMAVALVHQVLAHR